MRMNHVLFTAAILGLIAGCTSSARDQRERFRAWPEPVAAVVRALREVAELGPESPPPDALKRATLEDVLRASQARSPQLGAAYYRWKSAVDAIGTAVQMPEAMLEYREYVRADRANIERMDTRRGVMLTQMITNPGTLAARQRMYAADAGVMAAEFDGVRREVRRRVITAYVDLQVLDRRQAILRELAELATDLERLMQPMVETGMASQADLLRMQIEREEMRSDLDGLDLRRPALLRALEAASGLALDPAVELDPLADLLGFDLPARARMVAALDKHPMLQMSHAMARAADAKVDEAGWMWVPDFFLGVEWMQMDTPRDMPFTSAVGVTAGITIPWQVHVNAARLDSARAAETAARLTIAQKRLDLGAELELMLYDVADAERMIGLVSESTLPKARQALALIRADFTTGKADLTDVLSTLNTVLAAELTLAGARGMALRAGADLEAMTGLGLQGR